MKRNNPTFILFIMISLMGIQSGWCDGYKNARKEIEQNSRPWFVAEHINHASQDTLTTIPYDVPNTELSEFLTHYEDQKQSPLESVIQQVEPLLLNKESIDIQQKSIDSQVDEMLSKEVSIETVLSIVYARNPSIQMAKSAWQAAVERYPQAVYLEGILQQYNAFTKQLNLMLGEMQPQKQMIDADFPFPGMTALRGDIVQTDIEIAKQDYTIMLRDVLANTKTAFYEYVYIQRAIDITRENQALLEQLLQVASQKFEAGSTTYNDVIQARVALTILSNELITLQNQQQTLLARLNTLMNRPPDAKTGSVISPETPTTDLKLDGLYEIAIQDRQEIKKAELQINRITQMIEMAKIKNRPEPTVGASYFQDRSMLLAGSDRDREPFESAPMPQTRPWFGQREAFIAEMVKRNHEMQNQLQDIINQTHYAVKSAYFDLDKAQREAELYRTTLLDEARQSLEIAESDYAGARSDFLDYLTTQQNWLDFNLSYYMAQRDAGVAKVELERVIGSTLNQALLNTQQ